MASPFPAGNSGGEPSSGEESAGPEEEARALAEQFERAAERLPGLMQVATREQLLYLYARYKQVKFGNCNTPKPSFFDFEGKQKWEAWKALRDSSPHQAMQEYIATVKKLDPSWNPQGRALLHWACDRGHKELVSVLLQHAANINIQDDEGQTALHYASACEFFDIVELLLKSGADPTLLDQEGCLPEEVTDCKAITSMLQQHTVGKT
ncbi:acyl-CoA-binding domain-containing protein 6 isoform X9 [Gopherus flavomarginatus]|uniref:acyl-CoA-binding domain-containing protein 6 isoform X9 n=1 Tax=Gopherus flavomarginatus TaxID=286002 RepID=UPI0021CC3648|nr:acyl-CoA-binding domain-containing protein 6 isoform X9 [Gopherus flavomarginatus]